MRQTDTDNDLMSDDDCDLGKSTFICACSSTKWYLSINDDDFNQNDCKPEWYASIGSFCKAPVLEGKS